MDNDNYTLTAHWKSIEYEYATCSNCGFNEYTDWDCTNEAEEKIKHFRVDKMMKLAVEEEARLGRESFRNFDLARYAKKTFGMFGGVDASVTLRCDNHLAGVVIDRFGSSVMMVPEDGEHFHVTVEIAVSRQFYGWVTSIGSGMEILSPARVRKEYQSYLEEILGHYSE